MFSSSMHQMGVFLYCRHYTFDLYAIYLDSSSHEVKSVCCIWLNLSTQKATVYPYTHPVVSMSSEMINTFYCPSSTGSHMCTSQNFPLSIVLRSIFASSLHITLWNLWVPLSPFCFCNLDCSLYVVMISLGLKILINPERFWCSPLSSCSCVRNKIFNVFCYRQYNFETYAFQ